MLGLLFGLMGLVPFAGILLGPVAIILGVKARAHIRQNPTLTGAGLANAGIVLGIVAVVFAILCLLVVAVVFYVVSGGPWRS